MSNAFFAQRYNISERQVTDAISSLKEKGYVILVSFDGRKRKLVSKHIAAMKVPVLGRVEEKFQADPKKSSTPLLDNNIDTGEAPASRVIVPDDDHNLSTPGKTTRKVSREMEEVFNLFAKNPARLQWRVRVHQREAAAILYEKYGIDMLRKRYTEYQKRRDEPMCPQIDSPSDFLEKMTKLERFFTN